MAKIRLKCRHCGSNDVAKDSWSSWNEDTQKWEHGDVYDHGFCNECGREQDWFDEEEIPDEIPHAHD